MSRITLYLDDATQALLARAAQASGVSKSRWVADIIRKHAADEWTAGNLALAGSFADFPLREACPATPPSAISCSPHAYICFQPSRPVGR